MSPLVDSERQQLSNENPINLVLSFITGKSRWNAVMSCAVLRNSGHVFQQIPDIHPAVRDVMMNQTFNIISLQFPEFETMDWIAWFEVKLIPILPSFNEVMLTIATSNVNCTNYQVM